MKFLIVIGSLLLGLLAMADSQDDAYAKTRQLMKGHEALYNEGWFVVTSTKEAIAIGQEDSAAASQAMAQARSDAAQRLKDYKDDIATATQKSLKNTNDFYSSGTERTHDIVNGTTQLWHAQWNFSKETYAKAWSQFTMGYLQFGEKISDDWDHLAKANVEFGHRTLHPMEASEMKFLMGSLYEEAENKSEESVWKKNFKQATEEFDQSYKESGEKSNSLAALPSVIWGNLKFAYYSFFKPAGITVGEGAIELGKGAKNVGVAVIGGTYASLKIVGDFVYTTGVNLYYVSKGTYHVFAPTVEGGFLGSVATVSTASMPAVAASGESLGMLNQVVVTTTAPVVAGGQLVIANAAATGKALALVTFDLAKGSGEVLVHETRALVVLGYNMLSQLPAQTLLGVTDTLFLMWDSGHLVIVKVTGSVNGVPISQVPVGTVLDANKIEKQGLKVEKLTDDPAVVQKVIEAAPLDMPKAH